MKLPALIFSLLFTTNLLAKSINMACVTELPTTSLVALTEGDNLKIRLIHHNGVKYMPVWSNIITPNDIPTITETANILSELGDTMEFNIPVKVCEVDELMMNCFGKSEIQEINGHKVNLWSVYTKLEAEKSFAGEFNSIWSNLSIDVDGKSYSIPMKYSEDECFKGSSIKDLKAKAVLKKLFL